MSEELYELPDDLGETARSKIVQLVKLDKSLDKKKTESAADLFRRQWIERKMPVFVREYEFAKSLDRGWRFDFACVLRTPPFKFAVEIEGLVMRMTRNREWVMGGRHGTIKGFKEDCVKYATAAMLGWTLVRFEQSQVKNEFAVNMCMRILLRRGWRANQ